MILTLVSYPFGGGEQYLLQTMKHATENNYCSIWVSFRDKYNNAYQKDSVETRALGMIYKASGDFCRQKVEQILKTLNPDVLHTQGPHADCICDVALALRIPVILGYHFWNGLINLHENNNKNIIANIVKHTINSQYIKLNQKEVSQYVVSDFMNEVITLLNYPKIENVICPIPDDAFFKIDSYNSDSVYVTAINIHHLKGGDIILTLIQELDLPFLVIQTEPCSEHLDKLVKKAISKNSKSLYLHHQSDMKNIYALSRIILIPTLVDETFCRVAYEAAANGIPLLTSGKGYIQSMLNIPDIICTDNWKDRVNHLYTDKEERLKLSQQLQNSVLRFREHDDRLLILMNQLSHKNIMIIAPWADQGLGIQARTYSKLLMASGYKVSIFSYLPYNCIDKTNDLQKDENEWKDYTHIYYSLNTREEITDREIRQFTYKYNIKICLLPEICFSRVFEISNLLKNLNIRVYAIPNVEIVRKKEIHRFNCFHKILSPTHILLDKFKKYRFNMAYIGHGVEDNTVKKSVKEEVLFLHVAGLNATERKQTVKIIDAFNEATKTIDHASLTITIEGNIPIELHAKCRSNKKITLFDKHLTHKEIIHLYKTNHVSIQVSSHEGLGLGFYESISCSTPVISLNTAPHNEVIKHGITGWLINCHYTSLTDNRDAIMKKAHFSVNNLAKKIIEISNDRAMVNQIIISTTDYFKKNCTEEILSNRIKECIF